MPEFEEDPDGFKLRGFPVHEGTEDHDGAIEDYKSSLPFVEMIQKGMDMFQQVKPIVEEVSGAFGDKNSKDGTPDPNELGFKGV